MRGWPNDHPQLANTHARPFKSCLCAGKQRAQRNLWHRCGGILSARVASDPANLHPHADVHMEDVPAKPALGTRCQRPLALSMNVQAE